MLEAGQDILYLAFSSGLSGTYQASCVAVGMLQEKFPSRRIACVGLQAGQHGGGAVRLSGGPANGWQGPALTRPWPMRRSWRHGLRLVHGGRPDVPQAGRGGCPARRRWPARCWASSRCSTWTTTATWWPWRRSAAAAPAWTLWSKHFQATARDPKGGTVFISHGDCADDCSTWVDKLRALGVTDIQQGGHRPVIGAHSGSRHRRPVLGGRPPAETVFDKL